MFPRLLPFLAAAEPSSVQNLPWVAHAVVGASLVAGLIMWLSGGKLLKPMFCVLGALVGGSIGFLLLPQATGSLLTVPSPYVGLGVGAVIGLIAGISLFRFAVAISTAVAFGIGGLLISSTYLHLTVSLRSPPPVGVTTAAIGPPKSREPAQSLTQAGQRVLDEGVRPVAESVRVFVSDNTERLKFQWSEQNEHNKVVVGVATLGAALFGFFISLFAPRRSTSLATALVGSAIVLGSAVWLLRAFDAPGNKYLDQGPMVWLSAWIIAAILGLAVQVRAGGSPKPASPAPM